MLAFYSRVFETIEVDSTAYGIPQSSTIEGWYAKTPENFTFSLKVPSEITHEISLRPPAVPLMERFVEVAAGLREKLGMILIQLPASFESNRENGQSLRHFLSSLPRDARFAVEFREPGWFVDWTYEELERNNVALALVEGKWIDREVIFDASERLNSKLAYIRMMGERDLEKFDRIYRDRTDVIGSWVPRIESLRAEEIFIYADNYFEGHGPATANKIKTALGVPALEPADTEDQPSLF